MSLPAGSRAARSVVCDLSVTLWYLARSYRCPPSWARSANCLLKALI